MVAVYHRCDFDGACTGPYIVDVRSGGERRLKLPARAGCTTNKGSASMWRGQLAFTRSCSRGAGSGVLLMSQGGRLRRLLPLAARAAKFTSVDIVPGFVAVGARVLSTSARGCGTSAPTPEPEFEVASSYLTPSGILWWVEENIFPFGGAETLLKSAQIGRDCSVTPRGSPKSLNRYNDDTLFPGISIDGQTIYFGNIALPLSELG